MKKLTQAEARKIVPRFDWGPAPTKIVLTGDYVSAVVPLGKNDTLTVYAPAGIVDKLVSPRPKAKPAGWEQTRANCS